MALKGWVWVDVGGRRHLAFAYVDPTAGPSAKGGALSARPTPDEVRAAVERPGHTFRKPAQFGALPLSPAEIAALGLPEAPPWAGAFRGGGAWRDDPALAKCFHPDHPDDLQIIVHDGEPRRTQRAPEACWARVTAVQGVVRVPVAPSKAAIAPLDPKAIVWHERRVYRATLLNQPHHLQTIVQGQPLLFLPAPTLPHPLRVTEAYLSERAAWAFVPCDRCGVDDALDPPTTMARTRFPDAPAGSEPLAFTAFCVCGGTMVLARLDDVAT